MRSPANGVNPYVYSAVCALVCFILLIPFWVVTNVPLQDYPPHMVRMYILNNLQDNPILQNIYRIQWELIPNLAMDLTVPILYSQLPLVISLKLFISLIVVMWAMGPLAIHYALFGRLSYWPLVSSFFVYNLCLLFGFLNYNFGAGLLFFVLAAWIWLEDRSPAFRIVLFSVLSTVLFFAHFIAFGIYGLAVVSYEAGRAVQDGGLGRLRLLVERAGVVAAQFVVPAAIFLFLSPTSQELVPTPGMRWGGLLGRLAAARSVIWFENGVLDYLAFAFAAAVFLWALLTGSLRFNRPFLVSLAVLSVAALLMPMGLEGPGLRHIRIPPVLAALFFAGTRWEGSPAGRRLAPLVAVLGLGLFLGRTASTAVRMQALDGRIAEFRESASAIREGSAVFLATVGPAGPAFRTLGGGSLLHMADYAVMDRSAFVPSVFADPGVQPMQLVDHYRDTFGRQPFLKSRWELLPTLALQRPDRYSLGGWQKKYDYLVVLNVWNLELAPSDCLTPVGTGSFFTIFEIDKSKDPGACWP